MTQTRYAIRLGQQAYLEPSGTPSAAVIHHAAFHCDDSITFQQVDPLCSDPRCAVPLCLNLGWHHDRGIDRILYLVSRHALPTLKTLPVGVESGRVRVSAAPVLAELRANQLPQVPRSQYLRASAPSMLLHKAPSRA